MLLGTRIEDTLIGGPSFGILFKGDEIVEIDGELVTCENILDALRGSDIPGSKVNVRVRRKKPFNEDASKDLTPRKRTEETVEVTRMATAEIADRRRIFDLFTVFKVEFDGFESDQQNDRVNILVLFSLTGPSCSKQRLRSPCSSTRNHRTLD